MNPRSIGAVVRADIRSVGRDPLAALVLGSVPIVALAPRVASWALEGRLDPDFLDEVLRAAPIIVVVLHVPFMVGAVSGLALVEARDDGVLPAIATTPPGLSALLGARLAEPFAVTLLGVVAGLWLAGAPPAAGWASVTLVACASGGLAVLVSLAVGVLAGTKVDAVAVVKVVGLPVHAAVALVWIDGLGAAGLSVLPSAWPARAFLTGSSSGALGYAYISLAAAAVAAAAGTRHFTTLTGR